MLDYYNTMLAFVMKSNWELKNAYFLFSAMQSPSLVKVAKASTEFARRFQIPISWALKPTIYKQFVGGETLEECRKLVELHLEYKVKSVLDYSAEGGVELSDVQNAFEETLRSIDYAKDNHGVEFAVFKPSAMIVESVLKKASENLLSLGDIEYGEYESFKKRIFSLCERARDNNVKLLVDAERYAYQGVVDKIVEEAMRKFNREGVVVFQTLQMYRKDRLDYLSFLLDDAVKNDYYAGIKFVRGAYMEEERARAYELNYPDPILPDKESTDKSYNDGIKFALAHLDKIEIFSGSHNYYSNQLLADLMDNMGLKRNDSRIFFSQLYGMSDNITMALAKDGFNVCKYIPYAPVEKVLPYLLRRVEENSSVVGQSSRELLLIKKEIKRRKKFK